MTDPAQSDALNRRFGADDLALPADAPALHQQLAARSVMRHFTAEPVPYELLRRLCALALCAPTKSDLQQRDIVIVDDPALVQEFSRPSPKVPSGRHGSRMCPRC